jgi:cobalt-precorrin 5A hydrolase
MSAAASHLSALDAPTLAIGLGCDRGTPLATVQQCLNEALALVGAQLADVAVMASIEAKSDEAAFLQLALQHGWPLRWYSAAQLAAVPVPNPSATVQRYMGTPSVSEAAALLAAQAEQSALVVEKHKLRGPDGKNATVSIARVAPPLSPPVST